MQFDVRIPKKDDPTQILVVVVEARDSLSALRSGLDEINDSIDMSAMVCDFSDPDCLRVTDPATDRTIVIAEHDPNAAPAEPEPAEVETAPVASQPTEDLVAIPDQPETRELEAPSSVPPTADVPAHGEIQAIPEVEVSTNENLGRTELYIPTFAVEEAMAKAKAAAAQQAESEAMAATQAMSMPSSPSGDLEVGEATVFDPSGTAPVFDPSGTAPVDHTIMETQAVPDSRADLPSASPEPIRIEESEASAKPPGQNTLSIRALTGSEGQYKPGMTTETLAGVFMRAMEIYDYEDRSEAMDFVMELAKSDVTALGGAVLLTDINSPEQVLWFESVMGPNADVIRNLRVPIGQGIIGYCAQQGVSQNVADVSHEPRYAQDILSSAGLAISSLLCVPVQHESRVYGAVVLFNPPGMRPFTQGEVSIISYLAHVAGEYLGQNHS
ncbi:MAG: GAF domain-containing protein [Deltaproteobacteria bacterium]|nr:MAG: GAF domain-containing protein [Deltaproteobacteria bacterium]